jgi:hypothetical protein
MFLGIARAADVTHERRIAGVFCGLPAFGPDAVRFVCGGEPTA